ncbi:MAG TPA: CARDB domain-containing protein [Gaiellaceae bacterium]|nr:CARDB domain-containing protein [Gaiellaceae bacterium]
MFDSEKTEPHQDIEFDFFDESPTAEATTRKEGGRRRRRLPPRPPAPPGGSTLYRRGVLIAGAIVLAVILILVIDNCRGDQKQSEYEGYVEDVGEIAAASQTLGRELNGSLTTPGIQLERLRGDIEGLRGQQEQLLRSAQELRPPGPLLEQQEAFVEAMQFRVNGLDGLARAFTQVAQTSDAEESGAGLATQAQRLVASDVVYADGFRAGTQQVLQQQGVTDVSVPESTFVQNEELGSPTLWAQVVQRLTQGPQTGGLHGNGIQAVRWQPEGQDLAPGEDNTVRATDDLSFQVVVENSGDFQETQVEVTLVVQQDPVIRKRQFIDLIDPGETETVTFRDFPDISFSTRSTLRVTVEPVAGERNTGNNTAQYPVIFTLG